MLFSSMTFIFVFMPILCLIYFLSPKRFLNHILLIASLVFYAWGEPRFLLVMLFTIIANYIFGLKINEAKGKHKRRIRLYCLIFGIVFNLSVLFYFKYFNFIIENLSYVLKVNFDLVKVLLPLGISFYTFQSLSYLVDIYRGDARVQKSILNMALYITLFPQLIAGPIVKYKDVNAQIEDRKVEFNNVIYGIKRFIIGLSKKMLIANTCGEIADKIFIQQADSFSSSIAWLGAVSYALQLFFDFSGYSDMAIGLGYIFGFKFNENFNYPYISKSITEFWRRWHISLSTWFKQYLYIPLGGNRICSKRTYINLLIVFLATGVWHGAAWTFIVWGLWNALFILIERFFGFNKDIKRPFVINLILHIYCILAFLLGWVLFRSESLSYAITYISNMLYLVNTKDDLFTFLYYVDVVPFVLMVIGLFISTPICANLIEKTDKKGGLCLYMFDFCLVVLFIISTSYIASSTYNPFIYFRF